MQAKQKNSTAPGLIGPTADDEALREWVSACLDGEASAEERQRCLARLCSNDELRADWTAWHAVGDALRSSEVAAWHRPDFCGRVMQALQEEPTVLAPRRLSVRTVRRVVLPGAAVAAAAVVMAVVAVPLLRGPAPEAGPVQVALPASAPAVPAPRAGDVDRLPQLEAYLAAHQELTSVVGMGRTTPYLRASASTNER